MTRSKRQSLFEGAEAPPSHLAIDPENLRSCLAHRLPGLNGPLEIEKFKGGQSNPTYRIRGPSETYVLRRRPPGARVSSAHAIDREYRVLHALAAADLPVPRPILYCAEENALGYAFTVVEHVEGRIFWDADLPDLESSERSSIYDQMNATLARLHNLDPHSLGLGDLAPSDSFVRRNLARWSAIYAQSQLTLIDDMDWLVANLPKRIPETQTVQLLHGDYGLYNIIFHHNEPRLLAVLDWEMATLGEPLVDLAHHLRPYWEPPDPEGAAATSLEGLDFDSLGIPSLDDYVKAYARRRRIPTPDLGFHLAFAQFRYAAMIQGILKRTVDGTASGRIVLHRQERVVEVARRARQQLELSS